MHEWFFLVQILCSLKIIVHPLRMKIYLVVVVIFWWLFSCVFVRDSKRNLNRSSNYEFQIPAQKHPRKNAVTLLKLFKGTGYTDLHLVWELPDSQRRGLRGQSVQSVAGLPIRCGIAQPDKYSRVGSRLVRFRLYCILLVLFWYIVY